MKMLFIMRFFLKNILLRSALLKNFSWTLIGNIVYAGCQWGMLMVLAKLGTPEMVGRFVLGLAITAPVITFANLQLRAILATDVRGEYSFGDYLGLRIIACVVAIIAIICIGFFGNYGSVRIIIMIMGFAKVIEALSDVFQGLFQRYERMDLLAISYFIKGPLSLAALAAGVYWGGLVWGVLGMTLSWLLLFFSYDVNVGATLLKRHTEERERSVRPNWNMHIIKQLAWFALPMGFGTLLLSLNDNIPRLFIDHYLGEKELGIFAALFYIQVAGTTVVRALTFSAAPSLARAYASPMHIGFIPMLVKMTSVGAVIGISGVIIAVFFGNDLLRIIYRPEYAYRTDVFTWLMAGSMMHYIAMFLLSGLVVVRYFRSTMALEIIVILTITIACYCLVPKYGLLGGAWAVGVGTSTNAIGATALIIYSMCSKRAPQKVV
jgi:O-antigen/teichoic acid export membrane protein